MFQSVRQHRTRQGSSTAAVDIAPLIDVVFILLIFFLVTATFVRDTGIKVDRPQASHTEALEPESLRISIGANGTIYIDGEPTSLARVRERVRGFVTERERASVIVIPDGAVPSARLVQTMDAARQAGAEDVGVATARRGRAE